MGDLLSNSEIFRKLGFDNSNQWIFYDERFSKFFGFLTDSITESNILSDHETLERDEMVVRGEWLDEPERHVKLQQLSSENPGLFNYTEADIAVINSEIAIIESEIDEYSSLIEDMRNTKHSINSNLSELEHSINALHNASKELLGECQNSAKQLEETQRENSKLATDAKKYFTKSQSPPLFVHQLPLDQYFLKCDSFMQHFTLYMKVNFKIQEYEEFETGDEDLKLVNVDLENLEKSIHHYTLAYLKEKSKAKATQKLIDNIDLSQIHCVNMADMIRETHELEILNEHHLKNTYETLMNDLPIYVQQHTQQRMELVLYENTRQKLERAIRRRENDKCLTKIISDALSNAELLWIAIQLDLEKKRNRFDNTSELGVEAQKSWHRVQLMRSVNLTQHGYCAYFVREIAALLSSHLNSNVRSEAKSCLYEYEKFGRLLTYAQQNMLNKKSCVATVEQLNQMKHLEQSLSSFVYDSPLEKPMFEHVRFLRPIFNASLQQRRIDKLLRNLRAQFQSQITKRMDNDKLWRYGQLMWIWFLTEPQRMMYAIDEVKKASAKIPSLTGIKTLGGIKRK